MRSSTSVESSEGQQNLQSPVQETTVLAAKYGAASTLMDSLLHDARNPLNALSINLEVLSERLRRQAEVLTPGYEKNLKVMREQVLRVDGILRHFADFIAPRPSPGEDIDFSEMVLRALDVLGHEGRKRRLTVRPMVEAGIKVLLEDSAAATFFALQPILRAILRSPEAGDVSVSLRKESGFALLKVTDTGAEEAEPAAVTVGALDLLCLQQRGRLEIRGGECLVFLPLV